jgi:hypothetical protein
MKFGGKHTVQSRMAAAEKRLGKTTGVSKGAAKVSAKPKVTLSGTKPGKKQVGGKATWTF